jgi:hypothetical protein
VSYDGTRLRPFLIPEHRPTDLAREAGCSTQYVYDVLNGHRPASERIIDAARRLGLPVASIYRNKVAA